MFFLSRVDASQVQVSSDHADSPPKTPPQEKAEPQAFFVTIPSLVDVTSKGTSLTKVLDLGKSPQYSDQDLLKTVQQFPYLEELTLTGSEKLTDAGVREAAPFLKGLKKLNLSSCKITGECFQALAAHCPNLKEVDFNWCRNLTDENLALLGPALKNVEKMNLSSCLIGGNSFLTLTEFWGNLRTLNLSGCVNINDTALEDLSIGANKLTQLDISYTLVTGSSFQSLIDACPDLKKVQTFNCPKMKPANLTLLKQSLLK